jgi:acyl-[acyl-carrier-protein]-phospholipid O-acyltransferase/long-chain-fatty-acid--[acyl-carrier-protein] ligase
MAAEKPVTLKDLTIIGKENLPNGGGFIILPSQLGYFDLLRLELLLDGRSIVYLVEQGSALHPLLKVHLEKDSVNAMSISPGETTPDMYRKAVAQAATGHGVIIYLPAEAASMTSPLTCVPGTKLEFLLKAEIPVLPLHVHRRQDTALPIERRYTDAEVIFNFGKLLKGPDINLASYQECLLALSEQSISESCPALEMSLGYALIQGFKKHGTRIPRPCAGRKARDEKTARRHHLAAWYRRPDVQHRRHHGWKNSGEPQLHRRPRRHRQRHPSRRHGPLPHR